MDIISFNEAATANGRIEKFIKDPDSNSGIVTVPKVIGAGESVTIPAGRVAVLPNVQVDGTLNIEGEVFIPAGTTLDKVVEVTGNQNIDGIKTFSSSPIVPTPTTGTQVANKTYTDTKQSKSELAYDINASSFIPNTLTSGAIIERGSNANGDYVKFADGTLICFTTVNSVAMLAAAPNNYIPNMTSYSATLTLPSSFVGLMPGYAGYSADSYNQGIVHAANGGFFIYTTKSTSFSSLLLNITWIGRWK